MYMIPLYFRLITAIYFPSPIYLILKHDPTVGHSIIHDNNN